MSNIIFQKSNNELITPKSYKELSYIQNEIETITDINTRLIIDTHDAFDFALPNRKVQIIIGRLISILISCGCIPNKTQYSLYGRSTKEKHTGIWDISDTPTELLLFNIEEIKNITGLIKEKITIYSRESYNNFSKISKEYDKHEVFMFKSLNGAYVTITNKLTWEIYFKIHILALTKIATDLDTDLKKELYSTTINILKGFCVRSSKIVNKELKHYLELCKKIQYDNLIYTFDINNSHEIKKLEEQKQQSEQYINELTKRIAEEYKKEEQTNILYNALISKKTAQTKEVVDYISNNPYISYIKPTCDNQYIDFSIKTPLIYYDEDFLETMIEEQDYTLDELPAYYLLFDIVFKQKKYKLWTYSRIRLHMTDFSTIPLSDNALDSLYNKEGFLPQPHVMEFDCQGNHTSEIRAWQKNLDYIGCFEQILAMNMNINFTDSYVTERLAENLIENCRYDHLLTFEDENGIFYSFNELYHKELE